jgi:phytanoyl-CoA hydroxylase
MPVSTARFRLDPRQMQHFEDEGYLVVENVFTNEDLQPAIDEISAALDERCRAAVAAGKLSRTYEEYDFEHRLTYINDENAEIAKSVWDIRLVLPSFFGLMTNPQLLDVAEQICGPELIASSVYRLRPKVRNHTWSVVPWHQDSGYFEPYCDLGLILTVWLPLVDSTVERGGLWVMPRMHKGGIFFHKPDDMIHYLLIPDEEFGGNKPVPAPVPKGGVLWSMDLRYQSATLPTNAKITHLPGETRGAASVGASVGVPAACNPPEPDFLVRSRLRPNEVMKTAEEFVNLRNNHVYETATDRWGWSPEKRKDPMGNAYKKNKPTNN